MIYKKTTLHSSIPLSDLFFVRLYLIPNVVFCGIQGLVSIANIFVNIIRYVVLISAEHSDAYGHRNCYITILKLIVLNIFKWHPVRWQL